MTLALVEQALVNGLVLGAVFALVALGLSLIWGVMNIVNFAHGDFLMLSMFAAYWTWSLWGIDPLLSLPVNVLLLFGIGLLTYRILVKRILNAPVDSQLFTTFGLSLFLAYAAFAVWRPTLRLITQPRLAGVVRYGDIAVGIPELSAALVSLVSFALIYFILKRTKIGKAIRATAQDREVAMSLGIDVDRVYALSWGIGLASVAVAGTFLSNFFPIFPFVGSLFVLIAFTVVSLGGFGNVAGTLAGGLVIGVVHEVFGALISPNFKVAIVFIVFILALLFRRAA